MITPSLLKLSIFDNNNDDDDIDDDDEDSSDDDVDDDDDTDVVEDNDVDDDGVYFSIWSIVFIACCLIILQVTTLKSYFKHNSIIRLSFNLLSLFNGIIKSICIILPLLLSVTWIGIWILFEFNACNDNDITMGQTTINHTKLFRCMISLTKLL